MKAAMFLIGAGTLGLVFGQIAPQNGDIFSTGSNDQAQSPARALQNLYKLAAEITSDPSSGYQPPSADQNGWPAETNAERQWDASIAANGYTLSQQQRAQFIRCAAYLNAAIDAMERGYLIQLGQRGNPAAQPTILMLYAKGRAEFAKCRLSAVVANNEADSGTPGSGSPGLSQPAGENADTARMYQLAAEMRNIAPQAQQSINTAVDHFLTGLASWAANTLTFLAQKPGVPLNQASQAIANYLTNDYNQNDQRLRAAAMQALREMQHDPARFFGENLPNLLPLPKWKALEQIAGVEKSAQRISAVAKAEQQFARTWGSSSMRRPGFCTNECVQAAFAQDHLWAANESLRYNGTYALQGRVDLEMKNVELWPQLKARYPNAGNSNPMFTPTQRLLLNSGYPIPASPGEIEKYMGIRPGSRGLVFVSTGPEFPSHVMNVTNTNPVIQFLDAVNRADGRLWFSDPSSPGSFRQLEGARVRHAALESLPFEIL